LFFDKRTCGGADRLIQPDTLVPNPADSQAYNRYAYCRNNPVMMNDPSGHSFLRGFRDQVLLRLEDRLNARGLKAHFSVSESARIKYGLERDFGITVPKLGTNRENRLNRLRWLDRYVRTGDIDPGLAALMARHGYEDPLAYFGAVAKRTAKHDAERFGARVERFVKDLVFSGNFAIAALAQVDPVRPYIGTAVSIAMTVGGVPAPVASAVGNMYTAYFAGGSAGDILQAGVTGAAAGYVSGGIRGSGVWSRTAQGATYGGISGGMSAAFSGGDIGAGIAEGAVTGGAMAAVFAGADALYKKVVTFDGGIESSPEWGPGTDPTSAKGPYDLPRYGVNNVGEQGAGLGGNGWTDLREGGRWSTIGNQIPGINAVAGLHDTFQINLGAFRGALNYPGMPVAAAVTYAGLLNGHVNLTYDFCRREF
jgi:hypothetical protein